MKPRTGETGPHLHLHLHTGLKGFTPGQQRASWGGCRTSRWIWEQRTPLWYLPKVRKLPELSVHHPACTRSVARVTQRQEPSPSATGCCCRRRRRRRRSSAARPHPDSPKFSHFQFPAHPALQVADCAARPAAQHSYIFGAPPTTPTPSPPNFFPFLLLLPACKLFFCSPPAKRLPDQPQPPKPAQAPPK